jgi:hypothetical protein
MDNLVIVSYDMFLSNFSPVEVIDVCDSEDEEIAIAVEHSIQSAAGHGDG